MSGNPKMQLTIGTITFSGGTVKKKQNKNEFTKEMIHFLNTI